MFRTLSSNAEPLAYSDEVEKKPEQSAGCSNSSASTESDPDAVERLSTQDGIEEIEIGTENEKALSRPSSQLKRTASHTLSRVASRVTTHSLPDPGPAPDGGLKAWTQVAMGWLAIATTWGWINCFGVFQTYYTLHLDVSPSTISWIGTIQNFLSFFIGAFSGRLLDAGYFLPTVLVGGTLQILGIFLMSICTKYWQFVLTQGVLNGVGSGIFFTPCMGLMATYFSKRRAFALGIASTGNATGGMIYPIIVRQLLPQIGFAWTVRVLGFLNLGILSLVLTLMKPRLPPRKSGPIIDWSAFKEVPYALFTLAFFFQVWDIYYTLYYIASYGVEALGLPFHSSTVLLILINGVGIPARMLPGIMADRFGALNMVVPISWCLVLVAWTWLAVDSITGLYIWVCFYGVHIAALQCLLPPTVASLTSDMRVIGSRLGMVFSCMGFAGLTGPPIGGAIQGAMGGRYLGAQIWSAGSAMICAIILTVARFKRSEGKLKVKV